MGTKKTEANNKYKSKAYDSLRIIIRKDALYNKETLQKIAEDRGMSLNSMVYEALVKYIEEN